jgi:hypothetical protein
MHGSLHLILANESIRSRQADAKKARYASRPTAAPITRASVLPNHSAAAGRRWRRNTGGSIAVGPIMRLLKEMWIRRSGSEDRGRAGRIAQLERLVGLHNHGLLSDAEFASAVLRRP